MLREHAMWWLVDNSHDRLNLDPSKLSKTFQHRGKERPEMSRTAKFGSEILQITENITLMPNTKLILLYKICKFQKAIFSGIYNILRPNFTILLILRCSFYSCDERICPYCLDQNLVHHGQCLKRSSHSPTTHTHTPGFM